MELRVFQNQLAEFYEIYSEEKRLQMIFDLAARVFELEGVQNSTLQQTIIHVFKSQYWTHPSELIKVMNKMLKSGGIRGQIYQQMSILLRNKNFGVGMFEFNNQLTGIVALYQKIDGQMVNALNRRKCGQKLVHVGYQDGKLTIGNQNIVGFIQK
ncbi:Hypothetical_protein [Hexamita inflata]|uniref:Hypothetical_protein n=1 Tax=Hexamita inflata TaxID=28002 RepID=A0AA86TYF1_9EUKA|nr:Hypothetical protein HINF_LOCUS22065 [Hexamita inflata]